MSPHWWLRFRIGIAVRLTVAFVAVAVLAVAAYTLVESGPAIIQFVDVHPDQNNPGSRRSAAVVSGEALLGAITHFGRATGIRIADDSPARVIEAKQASEDLKRKAADYLRRARTAGNAPQLNKFASLLRSQRKDAARMIGDADARRQHIRNYERHFEDVDIRMKDAIDRAWKIFGRVVARQFMIDMSRILDRIRPDLATLVSTGDRNNSSIAAIGANEATFAAALEEHETTLRRTQGDEWFDLMRSDLAALANARSALDGLENPQAAAMSRFEKANARLAVLLAANVGPAAAPSRGPTTRYSSGKRIARSAASSTDKQITFAWLSIFTLALLLVSSVATMLSIIRPVRRLMLATRRLATGESGVVVARGGIRELDSLAVSFNQMAEQLAAAQAVTRQYHDQLEAKVEERTRQLQHLAQHDPLTQLPNRRQLFVQLNTALASAAESRCLVGVFFLDLDNFKNINDSMGHVFGDRVLQTFAERLRGVCAPFGFAARVGGDEFTVIMAAARSIDEIGAAGLALVRAFQKPLHIDGRELSMSLSVGASVYPDHESDAESLLQAADAALFRAKELGRSQMCFFSPDLLAAAASKFNTEQGLRRAIERGEFELFFQPEVNAGTGQVDLVEALLRWRLPNGTYQMPADFLPVAEESGLIGEISDWVIQSAVETAARWHHTSWPEVRVAINLSSRQLLDSGFVDRLQDLLGRNKLPTRCIEIELTENVLQTGTVTIHTLRLLRAAGFGVALDDFGTGYSSLVSLEQLPLSRVKLDRGLIATIDTSARSLAIAQAIIGLCTSLGLEITAEGVERRAQLDALLGHPGMYLQGYLFSPAVCSGDVLPLIARMGERVRSFLQPRLSANTGSTQKRRALSSVK